MSDRLEIKATLSVSDEGEITGIAWPFGTPDRVGDVIEKGAFSMPASLPMLFGHDQTQVIGVWDEISESEQGLIVKGRVLSDDIARAKEVRAMVKAGAVSGLSIGFVTTKATRNTKGRNITALDLHEISVVAVPCHPGAQITSLKSDDTSPHIPQESIMETEPKIETPPVIANDAPQADTKAFDAINARLDKMEAKANRPGVQIVTPDAPKAEVKAFGNYLRRGSMMNSEEIKALTVANAADGGYLAPSEHSSEMLKLLREFSPFRQYARVISTNAPEIIFPRRLTSTTATWVAEIAARTESAMSFEQVKLTPHELATFTDVSNQLLEDNQYALEAELMSDTAESFAIKEGAAFISGDGLGKPNGLLNADGLKVHEVASVDAFTSAAAIIVTEMYHKLPAAFAASGVWIMNRKTLSQLRVFLDANERPLILDNYKDNMPTTLLGRPIVEMFDMPEAEAGTTPIVFGDMAGYRIVDRVGMSVLRDPYSLSTVGQTRFHTRKRVGGDVTNPDRFVKMSIAA